MKKLIEESFVVVKLDVLEGADKKHLENPGGTEVLEKLNGKDAGLPFYAVTDPAGKLLVNSNAKEKGTKGNVGYPAAPHEIDWFVQMVEATGKMSPSDLGKVKAWLQKHAPKQ